MSAVHSRLEADHVPIVVMSSVWQSNVVKTAYRLGAKAYMAKPFTMDYAYDLVNRIAINTNLYLS